MRELPRLFDREPIARHDAERLAVVVKAVVSAPRLQILSTLSGRPGMIAEEFIPLLGLSQATVSHHMQTLRDAGLVATYRDGRCVRYVVDPRGFESLAAAIRLGGSDG